MFSLLASETASIHHSNGSTMEAQTCAFDLSDTLVSRFSLKSARSRLGALGAHVGMCRVTNLLRFAHRQGQRNALTPWLQTDRVSMRGVGGRGGIWTPPAPARVLLGVPKI